VADDEQLSLQRLELRVDPPIGNARQKWSSRSILIVRLHDRNGNHGSGEASPLPDYSPDTLDDCERALLAIPLARLSALDMLSSPRALLDAHVPAARFALETALLDRLGRRLGRPVWSLLGESRLDVGAGTGGGVPLCALLPSDDPDAACIEARIRQRDGVNTFKLKIGPGRVQPAQLATLEALRSAFGDGVTLRLDANRSLDGASMQEALRELAAFRPEFVEEPGAELDLESYAISPCALALDESLQALDSAGVDEFLKLPAGKVLILKPTALGGLGRCLRLAARSASRGRQVVVSHALEGPMGWAACAHLALALGSAPAAGLWPLRHQARGTPSIARGQLVPGHEAGLGGWA
jgi:o-succinylbenzoate synthase